MVASTARSISRLSGFHDLRAGAVNRRQEAPEENLGRIFSRQVGPGFARYTKSVATSAERLGDLVTEPGARAHPSHHRPEASRTAGQVGSEKWFGPGDAPHALRPVGGEPVASFAKTHSALRRISAVAARFNTAAKAASDATSPAA